MLPEVLKVDLIENADPFNFLHISDKNARQEVESFAKNYEPKKSGDTGVKK